MKRRSFLRGLWLGCVGFALQPSLLLSKPIKRTLAQEAIIQQTLAAKHGGQYVVPTTAVHKELLKLYAHETMLPGQFYLDRVKRIKFE